MISVDAGVLNIQFPFSFPISNNKKGHPLLRLSVSEEAILLRSYLQFPWKKEKERRKKRKGEGEVGMGRERGGRRDRNYII